MRWDSHWMFYVNGWNLKSKNIKRGCVATGIMTNGNTEITHYIVLSLMFTTDLSLWMHNVGCFWFMAEPVGRLCIQLNWQAITFNTLPCQVQMAFGVVSVIWQNGLMATIANVKDSGWWKIMHYDVDPRSKQYKWLLAICDWCTMHAALFFYLQIIRKG